MLTRRALITAAGSLAVSQLRAEQVILFLEKHRRADGGYSWTPDDRSHISPTFASVGCYQLLGKPVPDAKGVAKFARTRYPVAERRRTERPLWRFDFEQVTTLRWLGESTSSFQKLAETWTKPADFKPYEMDGYPSFQHQSAAVCTRRLLGISQPSDVQWKKYFEERRRKDGTFNHTPASDSSGGHLLNTVWGLQALDALGETATVGADLVDWVQRCQLPSGGFTYAPNADIGNLDDVIYTWAALWLLDRGKTKPRDQSRCAAWLSSLLTAEGGFQDRPGGLPNPGATYYALQSFQLLKAKPDNSVKRAAVAPRHAIPSGSRVFTIQIQAPGAGSPSEAVLMAEKLGIHIWTAKNSAPGWIAEAQRIATHRKVQVQFAVGNEEYGTCIRLPGLGYYSHLDDFVAPADRDFGPQPPKKNFPYPWTDFRDTRIKQMKAGDGRMLWQFNENEELTRVLLDEAIQKGTYGGICSFHFGIENFLDSQPFLRRYLGRIPMVGLQDAHGGESFWWGDFLVAFRTMFIAKEPTWAAWLEALDRNHIAGARYDVATQWKLQTDGTMPHVREFLMAHPEQWTWWGDAGAARERPAAALTVLKPGALFEAGVPQSGVAVRLRLWADNSNQALPKDPRSELISLEIDGNKVTPKEVNTNNDRYLIHHMEAAGARRAVAHVRVKATGKEFRYTADLSA